MDGPTEEIPPAETEVARADDAPSHDWETSKENVAPVRRGRNVDTLVRALKMQPTDAERAVAESEREFEAALASVHENDRLDAWVRHVDAVQQLLPCGGRPWEELLERCTRALARNEAAKRDARYLRMWINYADCCRDADDVYSFLNANDIGVEHAALYEAWSGSLEAKGNMRAADEVLALGMNRSAEPLSRLRARHAEFQGRLAAYMERKADEPTEAPVAATAPLGVREQENSTHAPQTSSARTHATATTAMRGAMPMGSRSMAAGGNNNGKKGGFQVFVDSQFSAAPAPARTVAVTPMAASSVPGIGLPAATKPLSWTALPSRKDAAKENTAAATPWTQHTVPSAVPAKKGPSFAVFVDGDAVRDSVSRTMEKEAAADPVNMRRKLDAPVLSAKRPADEEPSVQRHLAQLKSDTDNGQH